MLVPIPVQCLHLRRVKLHLVKLGLEEADCLRLIALFGGRLRRNPIRIAKDNNSADVRYWHKADILNALMNVRFWG